MPIGTQIFFFLFIVARPITILLHELGHAIPALLVTDSEVEVYLGSYGSKKQMLKLKINRLTFFFKYNTFLWQKGLCVPLAKAVSIKRQILYILMGPLTSLFIALLCISLTYFLKAQNTFFAFLISITISALIDFFYTIIPYKEKIILDDDREVENDGSALINLLKLREINPAIEKAAKEFDNQNFEEAGKLYQKILSRLPNNMDAYRSVILCAIQIRDWETAKRFDDEFAKKFTLNSNDFVHSGFIDSQLSKHEDAISKYDKSLKLDENNIYSLNNRGYTFNLLERYSEAIEDFNKVIKTDPEFAYAYNNRGLAKIKLGAVEDGLEDISKSIELDENNSYAYKNLGIFHFDKGEIELALTNFMKAKDIDKYTHEIDLHIEKCTMNKVTKS